MSVLPFYESLLENTVYLTKKKQKKKNLITILRLFVFILLVISTYWCFKLDRYYYTIFIFLIVFLFTIWMANKVEKEALYLNTKIKFLNEEIGINNNTVDTGNDLVNVNHFYSSDIDLFGLNSLFTKINKTCTQQGRIKLTNRLLNPSNSATDIVRTQQAVKELIQIPEWCVDFIVTGRLIKEKDTLSKDDIKKWLEGQNIFDNPKQVRYLIIVSSVINVLTLTLILVLSLSYLYIIIPFLIEVILLRYNSKKINTLYNSIGNKEEFLKKYLSLISKVEKRKFTSSLLQQFADVLTQQATSASIQINNLTKICTAFDNRKNVFISAILNIICLWDIGCAWEIENWKSINKINFDNWLETISDFDSIVSLSIYSFNNPEFVFPEITKEGDILLNLRGVAHPLINPKNNIPNDFKVKRGNTIFLITGANMAGKSTFLRTISINLVLAMAGAKVCASYFGFTPMRLITSMRNMDSIEKNESFFLAELNRLKLILNYINEQNETLVIIDEPLRGTNSLDKTVGSTMLIKKILSLNKDTCVLLATHDISLTEIAKEYPKNVIPKFFDIEIIDNQIEFDYKIKDGIASKMNAVELMKNRLIID